MEWRGIAGGEADIRLTSPPQHLLTQLPQGEGVHGGMTGTLAPTVQARLVVFADAPSASLWIPLLKVEGVRRNDRTLTRRRRLDGRTGLPVGPPPDAPGPAPAPPRATGQPPPRPGGVPDGGGAISRLCSGVLLEVSRGVQRRRERLGAFCDNFLQISHFLQSYCKNCEITIQF